jgi:hypothetical protein
LTTDSYFNKQRPSEWRWWWLTVTQWLTPCAGGEQHRRLFVVSWPC